VGSVEFFWSLLLADDVVVVKLMTTTSEMLKRALQKCICIVAGDTKANPEIHFGLLTVLRIRDDFSFTCATQTQKSRQ